MSRIHFALYSVTNYFYASRKSIFGLGGAGSRVSASKAFTAVVVISVMVPMVYFCKGVSECAGSEV